MDPITFQTIIRQHADLTRRGLVHPDLTPRQARLTAVVLATASNDAGALATYATLTAEARQAIVTRTWNRLWDGNVDAFAEASGKAIREDTSLAFGRAHSILLGI